MTKDQEFEMVMELLDKFEKRDRHPVLLQYDDEKETVKKALLVLLALNAFSKGKQND